MKKILLTILSILTLFAVVLYFHRSYVEIINESNQKIVFDIYTAATKTEREKGLSIYNSLDQGMGMLFVYQQDSNDSYWMKGMQFPLDIIFIDANMKIISISKDNQPCDQDYECELIKSDKPYRYVLEVNSNLTGENMIRVGNSIKIQNITFVP